MTAIREGDLDWQDRAACGGADPDVFFPASGTSMAVQKATALHLWDVYCIGCPVRSECFTYAVESSPEYGIWAGTLPPLRLKIKRRRTRAKCPDCGRPSPSKQSVIRNDEVVVHQICPACGTSWPESTGPAAGTEAA